MGFPKIDGFSLKIEDKICKRYPLSTSINSLEIPVPKHSVFSCIGVPLLSVSVLFLATINPENSQTILYGNSHSLSDSVKSA